MREKVMDVLRSEFKPEFLNRIDEIIVFNRLGIEQIKEIVDIQINKLKQRLSDKKIDVVLSPEAKEFIANVGYDPVYGARPIKRAIQQYILDQLAMKALQGEFSEGDKIKVDVANDELVFSVV
jgi:ATP-dependent Clp protease ATP-binding subunit ClpB